MLIYSTTAEFCQGDDFIRDGVRRLLNVAPEESEIWINRFGVKFGGVETNVWQALRNMPPTEEYMPHARAFVFAGSPAWLHNNADWWERCIEHNLPIWIIGGGSRQSHPEVLERGKHLIQVATVRDAQAETFLSEADVPCRRFLDPGFHAPYFHVPRVRDIGLVLTYRERRAHHEESQAVREAAYVGLWKKFRPDVLVVHEPNEIEPARRLFGVEPFFSHEHRRYADIYCRARAYIGGRLHGAIPVLAAGGEAHLLYSNAKTEGVTGVPWLPVTSTRHPDWEDIEIGMDVDEKDISERVHDDFVAHSLYIEEKLS